MKAKTEITTSEWLAALDEVRPALPKEAKTLKQIMELWGLRERHTRSLLKQLEANGRAVKHSLSKVHGWVLVKPKKPQTMVRD